MSVLLTVARPYAKAAFDFAVEHQNVAHWQSMLAFAATVSRDQQIVKMLSSAMTPEKVAKTFIMLCSPELDMYGQNLIRIMAEYRRLTVLSHVLHQFVLFCAAHAIAGEVDVISTYKLKEKQLEKIKGAMEKRFSCTVKLNCKIDQSILAGVVVRTDNMVINGSLQSQLERLTDFLRSERTSV